MPQLLPDAIDSEADLTICRELLRVGSKSFSAASKLLPRRVRDSATILYAFCREADDLIDAHDGGVSAIVHLRKRLDDLYLGTPQAFATDRALAGVVAHHALPRALLDALIEGFEWDVQNRRYSTLAELEAYAARVAGTIGAMMAVLMGVRAPSAIARACDLGVAMQLTNIARDVGEDARAGRIYLPIESLRAVGVDADHWLANPQINDGIRVVVKDLLRAADRLYSRVESGVTQLPLACRPGIHAAKYIYADIGRFVENNHFDSVTCRASVPARRKAWLLLKSFAPKAHRVGDGAVAPLAATAYLVAAVAPIKAPLQSVVAKAPAAASAFLWWDFKSRALWLIDLFERMERRERIAPLHAPAQEI